VFGGIDARWPSEICDPPPPPPLDRGGSGGAVKSNARARQFGHSDEALAVISGTESGNGEVRAFAPELDAGTGGISDLGTALRRA